MPFEMSAFSMLLYFKWIFQYYNNIVMIITSVAENMMWLKSLCHGLFCFFWTGQALLETEISVQLVAEVQSSICLSLVLEVSCQKNLIINLNLTAFVADAGMNALFS